MEYERPVVWSGERDEREEGGGDALMFDVCVCVTKTCSVSSGTPLHLSPCFPPPIRGGCSPGGV